MKKIQKSICFLCLFFLFGCANTSEANETLTISSASSLTEAIHELVDVYEKEHKVAITLNLASSGKLAQQIEQGAPVDLYLSANKYWMNQLEKSGKIDPDTRTTFARNQLVVITKKTGASLSSLEAMTNISDTEQIAMGEPASVPAGTYTKQALETIHLWEQMNDKLVYASNVRQVLAYVESGNIKYGFVYQSDAKVSDKVRIALQVDPSLHKPIRYPGAVVSTSSNEQDAKSFLTFLQSEKAQAILSKYGFSSGKKVKDRR